MKKIIFILSIILFLGYSFPAASAPVPVQPSVEKKELHKETPIKVTQEPIKEVSKPITKELPELTQGQIDEINDLREQAKFLYNSNEINLSMEAFLKIPDTQKTSDDWILMANIAQDNGKPVDTVFYLKKAIQTDDKNFKAHYNLGNAYFADQKINMALAEYKKSTKLKKDFAYGYYNMGCCYLKKKSWFNARYMFGLAIKENPNEPSYYYNLAFANKMLKKTKKAQEALDVYEKLMKQ